MCASHSGLVQDKRVHGGATVGAIVHDAKPKKPEKMKQIVAAGDMNVAVTSSNDSGWKYVASAQVGKINETSPASTIPEGRVHGGSLMAIVSGCPAARSESNKDRVSPSQLPMMKSWTQQNWL